MTKRSEVYDIREGEKKTRTDKTSAAIRECQNKRDVRIFMLEVSITKPTNDISGCDDLKDKFLAS